MPTRQQPASRLRFQSPVILHPLRLRHSWRALSANEGPRGALRWVCVCRRCGLQAMPQTWSRQRVPPCYAQQEIDWRGDDWMARFVALNSTFHANRLQETRHADAA